VEVRRARAEDLAGVRAIASSYGNLDAWPQRPDYLDLELEQDGLWVALDADGVVGFAGLIDHGTRVHLADLFVRRDARGGGIGAALLAAALPAGRPLTTLAALSDPRALPLYARAGLVPLAPVLYVEGVVVGGSAVTRQIDVAETGSPVAGLLARAGASALATADGATAVIRPDGTGAHLGPATAGGDALMALVARASVERGRIALALPGPHPALRPLLEAGMRVTDVDAYMATEPGLVDLESAAFEADLG
jgi:GNAT superfamily N-acetyltransferase